MTDARHDPLDPVAATDGDAPTGGDAAALDDAPVTPEAALATEAADGVEGGDSPTLEGILGDLEAMITERDEYLALAQAKQAEFENYKKRVMKQQAEHLVNAATGLVDKLLPVLDAFDAGVRHGDESLGPLRAQLLGVLEKEGLSRIEPTGEPFDPTEHEAVAHEPGEGEPVVAETLRAGYLWNGRLRRAAMVRVKG
ncbi:MAG: nucleotide exchange factor GrpE [Actinomycetota bacterium]|nr:nucleotide exchange factor GrpE [Actinomycetota bacterium]